MSEETPEIRPRYPVGSDVYFGEWWRVSEVHLFNETAYEEEQNRGNPYNRYTLRQKGHAYMGRPNSIILFEYKLYLYPENLRFSRQKGEPFYLLNRELVIKVICEYINKHLTTKDDLKFVMATIYEAIADYEITKDLWGMATFKFHLPWEQVRQMQAECVENNLKRGPDSYVKKMLDREEQARRDQFFDEHAKFIQETGNY